MKKILFCMGLVLLFSAGVSAQRVITGKITDQGGNPLTGATILAGKANAVTNSEGNYSIVVPAKAKELTISYVGYGSQTVSIGSQAVISVKLNPAAGQLAEVVVQVPYGTVKKTSFTGSENTVTAATLQKQQVTTVTNALEGVVPGVIATNGGGDPGGGSSGNGAAIRIRGIGSVNASSAPLYVVNGTPFDGDISSISVDDIESLTVLKDASASALYGSRAANGVIMINTRKGKKGRSNLSATIRQGVMTRGIPEYDRVDQKDYYELMWEAYRNAYVASGQTMEAAGISASNVLTTSSGLGYNSFNVPGNKLVDSVTGKLNPNAKQLWNDSWEDALYRQAARTNATINLSGASDNVDYYLSAGYLNEEGIVKESSFKRYSMRLNVNISPVSWFKAGMDLNGAFARRNDISSGGATSNNSFYFTRNIAPIYPVYQHDLVTGAFIDSAGQHKYDYGVPSQMGARPKFGDFNPVGILSLDQNYTDEFSGNTNVYAQIDFLKDFSFKTTLGLNYLTNNNTQFQNSEHGDAAGVSGRSTKFDDRTVSLTANEILSWRKNFGSHSINALAGHESYRFRYNYLNADMKGFLFPNQPELLNGTDISGNPSSDEDNHRIESYLANVNYDFNQKYLASASFRTDGSSRFAKDVRWGNFYSVGAGWRVSQEKFMEKFGWLNELKLRASYGEQGNENLGGLYYQYTNYYTAQGDGTYQAPRRPANPDLRWEKNRIFNLGTDFLVLKRRLSVTFEYFNKISSNLLFDVPLPISTGYPTVYQNIGTMKNYGFELQLGYNAIRNNKFNWRVDMNLTTFKNKITRLAPKAEANGIVNGSKKLAIGHSIYDYWLPEYAGVDPSNGDALYYRDIVGADGKVSGRTVTNTYTGSNGATFYFHGSAIPKLSGGLTNSFNYKGFDLSVLTTFSYGGLFYDVNYANLMHRGDPGNAFHSDILERWQKPGDITTVPRLQNGIANQEGASTRWLMDASWLKIKNITLSYTFNKKLLDKMHVAGLQVFGNVDNAWLFSAKKGSDPQQAFSGVTDALYTPFRTVSFGLNISF